MVTSNPWDSILRSEASSPTSSERRNAPAKPSSKRALSRHPYDVRRQRRRQLPWRSVNRDRIPAVTGSVPATPVALGRGSVSTAAGDGDRTDSDPRGALQCPDHLKEF